MADQSLIQRIRVGDVRVCRSGEQNDTYAT